MTAFCIILLIYVYKNSIPTAPDNIPIAAPVVTSLIKCMPSKTLSMAIYTPTSKVITPSNTLYSKSNVPIRNAEKTCLDGKDLPAPRSALIFSKGAKSIDSYGLWQLRKCRIRLTRQKGIAAITTRLTKSCQPRFTSATIHTATYTIATYTTDTLPTKSKRRTLPSREYTRVYSSISLSPHSISIPPAVHYFRLFYIFYHNTTKFVNLILSLQKRKCIFFILN